MKKKQIYENVKETFITKREPPTISTENRKITLIDSDEEEEKVSLKLVFLGNSYVGKSTIIKKYCNNSTNQEELDFKYSPTKNCEFYYKELVLQNKNIILKILDICGESNNSKMVDAYLYKADGIIYVYEISNDDSFYDLDNWLSNVTDYYFKKNKEIPQSFLISNKMDLYSSDKLSTREIKKFIIANKFKHYPLSCKSPENVEDIFTQIIGKILGYDSDDRDENNVSKLIKEIEEAEMQKQMETKLNIKKMDTLKSGKSKKIENKLKNEILSKDKNKFKKKSTSCTIF